LLNPTHPTLNPKPLILHPYILTQLQSPVSLRLLPTLPARQLLHGPTPSGSQTDRGGAGAKATAGSNGQKNNGSKTQRVMASTNATSLAAVKQVGVVVVMMMMMVMAMTTT